MQVYLQKALAEAAAPDVKRPVARQARGEPPPRPPGRSRAGAAKALAGSARRLDRDAARRAVA